MRVTYYSYFRNPYRIGPHFFLRSYKEKGRRVLAREISRRSLKRSNVNRKKEGTYETDILSDQRTSAAGTVNAGPGFPTSVFESDVARYDGVHAPGLGSQYCDGGKSGKQNKRGPLYANDRSTAKGSEPDRTG